MDLRRVILYAMLAFVTYSIWTAWQHDYPIEYISASAPTKVMYSQKDLNTLPSPTISGAEDRAMARSSQKNPQSELSSKIIHVKTDVLDLSIDLNQGNIIDAQLLKYPKSTEEHTKPFALLYQNPKQSYVANSQLLIVKEDQIQPLDINFISSKTEYHMEQ